MTLPRVIELPDDTTAVERLYEHAINADDGAVGQAYIVEDDPDHAGHKRAAFKSIPGVGDVAAGTPGNWSHAFVTEAGGTYVLGDHAFTVEPLVDVGMYRRVLLADGWIRGQATVAVAGYLTAYLDCEVSLDDGATWETELLGVRVPLKDAKHAVGIAVQVDAGFVGDVLLRPVVVGGDGTEVPEILNFIIESYTAEPPPADGEAEPIDPVVPTDGLVANWELTETSGQTVANKTPGVGTANLILGDTTSVDGRDPTWAGSPRRLTTAGFATVDHHYAHYDSIPSLVSGCAIFFYGDITSIGGLTKYLCGVENSGADDHQISLVDVGGVAKARAYVLEDTGGGTVRTVTGTTTIVNGSKHVYGLLHDGTTLGIYVDPADGMPEATTACSAAKELTTPRRFVIGAGSTPITSNNGPDVWAFGDTRFYAGASVASLTPDEIAGLYQAFKLVYTDLP